MFLKQDIEYIQTLKLIKVSFRIL